MADTCKTDYSELQGKYNDLQGKYNSQIQSANDIVNMTKGFTPIMNKLLCGPECIRQKKLAELSQIYNDAKTTVVTAPSKLKIARQNYVSYDKGDPAYDDLINSELNAKADIIAKTYNDQFISNLKEIELLVKMQNSLTKNLTIMQQHNTNLTNSTAYGEDMIEENEDDIIMNDRKTYYENQNYDTLLDWYSFFSWIYWFIAIIFVLSLLLSKNEMTLQIKAIYIIGVILYFFTMKYILIYLFKLLFYLYNLLPKNVYTSL